MSELQRRECLARQEHSAVFHNFHLIHRGRKYPINKHLLSGISRSFYRFLIDDPSARELEIPPYPGDLSDMIGLLYGKHVRISKSNCRFLVHVAKFLDIPRLEIAARGIQSKTNTMTELVKYSEQLLSCQLPDAEAISRIAANFDEFWASPLVLSVSVELLELVLNSQSLSIPPSALISFILTLIALDCCKYRTLIRAINFNKLDKEQRLASLSSPGIDLNQLRGSLIPILRRSPGSIVNNRIFTVSSKLNGLLRFLYEERRLIVTASSVFSQNFGLDQLLDIGNSYSYFSSKTGPNEWIEFAFEGGQIQLTEYILRGWKNSHAGVCPVSWVLWGADAKGEWIEIDRRADDQSLKQDGNEAKFQVRRLSHNCSQLKFQQQQTGNPFNGRLVLSGIEFFGIWRERG
jgi:hypothetical protein